MNPRAILTLPVFVSLIATLWACGDGNPPPAKNNSPIANLTANDTVKAGAPLSMDGSTSSDADGDPLTHSWDFGDGVRGGTAKIAHVYASNGLYKLKLTVGDSKGGFSSAEKTISVTTGATSSKSVNTLAIVTDLAGVPISGVKLSIAETTATTGADGRGSIITPVGVPITLQFSKSGFADQFKELDLPDSAESGYLEVKLIPREANQTLPDAAAGGAVTGKEGATVTLPANALVDSSGNAVTGSVQVAITPVDVGKNIGGFPGKFEGMTPSGQSGLIVSYGTTEFVLSKGLERLNLAPGRAATIEIPVYTALNLDGSSVKVGDSYPMWSLDERTSGWVQEGTGVVVISSASPSGLALRGSVTHFSWWNHDDFAGPPYKPKPKCMVDTNADGILEDLTGTGHCWHGGTGLEQPDDGFGSQAVRQQALVPRIPAFMAEDTTPAAGGKILEMPANINVLVRSSALDGTLAATTIFKGPENLEEDVVVLLKPVITGSQDTVITIPWDQPYSISSSGEKDRFRFAATANGVYRIQVGRNGSSLNGTVKLRKGNTLVKESPFNATQTDFEIQAEAAEYTLEISSNSSDTGGYFLRVTNPTLLSVPFFQDILNTGGTFCGSIGSSTSYFAVQANQTLALRLVTGTNQTPNFGSLKLFEVGKSTQLAMDSFGNTTQISDVSEGAFVNVTASQNTTYRVETTWNGYCQMLLTGTIVEDSILNSNHALGNISNSQEARVYKISTPNNLVISAGALAEAQANNARPRIALELYENNTRIASNYREPSSSNASFKRSFDPTALNANTNYFLVVRALPCQPTCSPAASNLQLGISTLAPTPAPTETITENFAVLGGIKYYSFNLTQGEIARIIPQNLVAGTFLENNILTATNDAFYLRPKLFTNNLINPFTIVANSSGEHILEIRGLHVGFSEGSFRTGTFKISIERPIAKTLSLGVPDNISIPFYGIATYEFSIPNAGNYTFVNPRLNNDELFILDAGNNRTNLQNKPNTTLSLVSGTYRLVFSSGENSSRNIVLSVNNAP